MTNYLFVGLESSTDVWVSLRSLDDLLEISCRTKSDMNEELKLAYRGLKENVGDEIPVDGKDTEILINELSGIAHIETSIGGSAAIETSQFIALGERPYYLGNYYPHQLQGSLFSRADFSLAIPSKLNPISIILQTTGDRFILANGEGRRIDNILNYIKSLPGIIEPLARPEALSLVGWHVLFSLDVDKSKIDSAVSSLRSIRKLGISIFTDTGGFGKKSDQEILRLWEIYESFDILSMNEWEFQRLCKVLSLEGSEEQRLSKLLELSQNLKTIWLHAKDYQMSISYQFSLRRLAIAQEFSSAAGCLRVETGRFPSISDINDRSVPGRSNAMGDVVKTRSLRIRSFTTEVGAGDVSAASFLWKLLGLGSTNSEKYST